MKYANFHLLSITLLSILFFTACNNDKTEAPDVPPVMQITVWSGPTVTFEKPDDTDHTLEANQDRITNLVWITRAEGGGQIFNAVTEDDASKDTSPAGTLWAEGTTADLDNLTFGNFRTVVDMPRNIVGTDYVMLLVEENIAIDIKFTSWSRNKKGGFAYERSSN